MAVIYPYTFDYSLILSFFFLLFISSWISPISIYRLLSVCLHILIFQPLFITIIGEIRNPLTRWSLYSSFPCLSLGPCLYVPLDWSTQTQIYQCMLCYYNSCSKWTVVYFSTDKLCFVQSQLCPSDNFYVFYL